ncbi:MAG: DUF4399 domain-containing protein [Myxococcota bacterium]
MRRLLLTTLLPAAALACSTKEEAKAPPAAPASAPKAAAASQPASAPAAPKGSVQFITPQNGSTVFPEVAVAMGLSGMTVRPAGEDVDDRTSGHHHVLIDQPEGLAAGTVVPASDKSIHYGKGQTTAYVNVPEGEHTLTLQLADGAHRSYGPDLAATVKVKVVPATGERKVSFLAPKDGAKVKSPVKIKMGLEGMKIRPAGEDPLDKTTGHHHLIINKGPIAIGTIVPADENHIHYGKGQTEAEVELPKGKHELTLQLADGIHASYGPKLSATITVEVE